MSERIKNPDDGQFITKYSPEKAQEIIDFMAQGYTLTAASGFFRISKQTIYNWMEADPVFKRAVDVAQNARQYFFEKELTETKLPARITAAIFALKTHKNGDFKETQAVELSGPDGEAIKTETKIEFVINEKENEK